jgi:hypothetical protein
LRLNEFVRHEGNHLGYWASFSDQL